MVILIETEVEARLPGAAGQENGELCSNGDRGSGLQCEFWRWMVVMTAK